MSEKPKYEDLLDRIQVLEQSKSELESVCRRQEKLSALLDAIRKAQSLYINEQDPSQIYKLLLQTLVDASESEYGFS